MIFASVSFCLAQGLDVAGLENLSRETFDRRLTLLKKDTPSEDDLGLGDDTVTPVYEGRTASTATGLVPETRRLNLPHIKPEYCCAWA